jgi:hypothetical protein
VWPRPGGYVLEALVTAADVDLPGPFAFLFGQRVGFNLSINLSQPSPIPGDCGYRLGQLFLEIQPGAGCGVPYCDVRSFCRPRLDELAN